MPRIGNIQTTNFPALLERMGINRNQIPFELRNEVIPVALIDSSVDFLASPSPAYRVPDVFTEGEQVAPGAGTVLADTGPLPVGAYSVVMVMSAGESNRFDIQWRDAANGANLSQIRVRMVTNTFTFTSRFNVENENERFRILNVAAGTVAIDYNATILARI